MPFSPSSSQSQTYDDACPRGDVPDPVDVDKPSGMANQVSPTSSASSTHAAPGFLACRGGSSLTAWLMLSPALILLGLFVLGPLIYLFALSFTTDSLTRTGLHWIGFRNYLRLSRDPDFWQVMGNSLYFLLGTVVPSVIISLVLAIALNRTLTLRGVLRAAFFIPSMTSMVAVGLGFRWLFQSQGPMNQVLQTFGLMPIPWLSSPLWAMPVVVVLSTWKQIGFNLVIFLGGLQTIPRHRYEAAALDGANGWQLFWHITLPGLRPTLVFASLTTFIFSLRSFEQIYVTTGGGPLNSTNILAYYIYDQAFGQFDLGYAAAAATILMLLTLLIIYCQFRIRTTK